MNCNSESTCWPLGCKACSAASKFSRCQCSSRVWLHSVIKYTSICMQSMMRHGRTNHCCNLRSLQQWIKHYRHDESAQGLAEQVWCHCSATPRTRSLGHLCKSSAVQPCRSKYLTTAASWQSTMQEHSSAHKGTACRHQLADAIATCQVCRCCSKMLASEATSCGSMAEGTLSWDSTAALATACTSVCKRHSALNNASDSCMHAFASMAGRSMLAQADKQS